MDLPELTETAENATQRAKNLIPWLPDPFRCPECNTLCDATHVYDPQTAAFHNGATPAWTCPKCGTDYRREEPWHE